MAVDQSIPARKHGLSATYFAGCRCDACRLAVNAYNRERMARRRASGVPERRVAKRDCAECGLTFDGRSDEIRRGKARFCSATCHNKSQVSTGARERERAFIRENGPVGSVRRRALKRARVSARGSDGGGRVWVQGNCIVCGESFTSPGADSRYCTRECRAKNRNRAFGLSWLDRMAIFARDGWICQICSEPVDYTADHLTDWYPTLDHIKPRSMGGSDDLSNLRTAHRWCNSVRGDLTYYTDADLAA